MAKRKSYNEKGGFQNLYFPTYFLSKWDTVLKFFSHISEMNIFQHEDFFLMLKTTTEHSYDSNVHVRKNTYFVTNRNFYIHK